MRRDGGSGTGCPMLRSWPKRSVRRRPGPCHPKIPRTKGLTSGIVLHHLFRILWTSVRNIPFLTMKPLRTEARQGAEGFANYSSRTREDLPASRFRSRDLRVFMLEVPVYDCVRELSEVKLGRSIGSMPELHAVQKPTLPPRITGAAFSPP